FCPEPAIEVVDEWPVVDYDYCKGCGICAEECPSKCIVMVEERK
ncbi:MAG: 4Fe-4S binding protein, partial [Candidatus Aminicenantes bacterium]|nr:4Fe-4S binding protein [Candidatus Aminicenantes bacterium]